MATVQQIGDDTYKPGGLIGVASTGPASTGYTPSTAKATQATATGYDPKATTVTPNQTVQGQVAGIIEADSPLMQQARRRADEASNARGMLNSSIGIGAAHGAVLDAAMPIATQDASTHFQANQKTVDAQNAALNFGAAAQNQASLANAQLGTDVSKTNAAAGNEASARSAEASNQSSLAKFDADTRMQLAQKDINTRLELASLDRNTQLQIKQLDIGSQQYLAQMENQYRQLLQSNQNLSAMYQQTVNAIANISIQPGLARATKDAAIATQLNTLREALAATSDVASRNAQAVSSLNLGQYFDAAIPSSEAGIANTTYSTPVPYQTSPNYGGGVYNYGQ